jgi:hypothetical protein
MALKAENSGEMNTDGINAQSVNAFADAFAAALAQ